MAPLSELRELASKREAMAKGGRDAIFKVDLSPLAAAAQAAVLAWRCWRPANASVWGQAPCRPHATAPLTCRGNETADTACAAEAAGNSVAKAEPGAEEAPHATPGSGISAEEVKAQVPSGPEGVGEARDRGTRADGGGWCGDRRRELPADTVTVLLRVIRKGARVEEWRRNQISRHAQALYRVAVPYCSTRAS